MVAAMALMVITGAFVPLIHSFYALLVVVFCLAWVRDLLMSVQMWVSYGCLSPGLGLI